MKKSNHIVESFARNFPFRGFSAYATRLDPFIQAGHLVRAFYSFLLFASVGIFFRQDLALGAEVASGPLWPVYWAPLVSPSIAFWIVRVVFIGGALSAVCFPNLRAARVLATIGLFEFVALYASALRLDIDWYLLPVVAFLFIFLPNRWKSIPVPPAAGREHFLLIFWAAQAVTLLTYSMAGLGKLLGAGAQIWAGQVHAFAPEAAARYVAERLILTNQSSALGPWIVAHPWSAWPFFLGSMYLLVFSFLISFRPSLHRMWGIGLVLFHVGNYLAINIGFSAHIFIDALLLIYSPFQNPSATWRDTAAALPVFGRLVGGPHRPNA